VSFFWFSLLLFKQEAELAKSDRAMRDVNGKLFNCCTAVWTNPIWKGLQ